MTAAPGGQTHYYKMVLPVNMMNVSPAENITSIEMDMLKGRTSIMNLPPVTDLGKLLLILLYSVENRANIIFTVLFNMSFLLLEIKLNYF